MKAVFIPLDTGKVKNNKILLNKAFKQTFMIISLSFIFSTKFKKYFADHHGWILTV